MNESRLSLQAETYEIQPMNKKMTPYRHARTHTHFENLWYQNRNQSNSIKIRINQNRNDEKKSTLKDDVKKGV